MTIQHNEKNFILNRQFNTVKRLNKMVNTQLNKSYFPKHAVNSHFSKTQSNDIVL